MRLIAFVLLVLTCSSSLAWFVEAGPETDGSSKTKLEDFRRQRLDRENAEFVAESQVIGARLAALNNTTVVFNRDVRHRPVESRIYEDLVAGEWILGTGAVCLRTVWTEQVICHGAQGFSLKKPAKSKNR